MSPAGVAGLDGERRAGRSAAGRQGGRQAEPAEWPGRRGAKPASAAENLLRAPRSGYDARRVPYSATAGGPHLDGVPRGGG